MQEIHEQELARYIRGIESQLKCQCGILAFFCSRHQNAQNLVLSMTEGGTVQAVLDRLVEAKKLTRLDRKRIEQRLGKKSEHSFSKTALRVTLGSAVFVALVLTGEHLYGVWVKKKKGPTGS